MYASKIPYENKSERLFKKSEDGTHTCFNHKTSHQQTIYLLKKYFRINAFWYLGYNDALTTIREERR